jgi:3-isopropylmalate dehydrogenase
LRPVKVLAGMEHLSPLKAERVSGADFVVVRELTGGLYFGEKTRFENDASDVCAYSRAEIERIAVIAFETAAQRRGLVTSVDKANVLATSKLWRDVVSDVAKRFSSVELEHLYVDAAAMELVTNPKRFDVILTENLFGDILSDEASVVPGSIGLLGSASLGEGGPGVFEPIHGSAPDIAGEDAANPLGMLASTVLMLRYGLDQAEAADALERACEAQLREGSRTRDVGGSASTSEVTAEVVARLPG